MKDILSYLNREKDRFYRELGDFLRIPSISTKKENENDMHRAASWVVEQLKGCGLEEVVSHKTDGHPIVTARTPRIPKAPTVLVYGHYDVQPPDPLELWKTPPFEPTIRDGKIYARGSADDKGQVFIYLKVLEAFHKVRKTFPVNVKLLVEGEEEIGSPSLATFLKKQKELLACDVILVSDTHMLSVN
ncbi:MAG: M20/M25/M40 family metallo-hydrolase, partial [Pseudomonadota bacterium]